MKKHVCIFVLILFVFGCKKNKNPSNTNPVTLPATNENSAFKCATLPPAPVPFGWKDTTTNVDHNINTFMFNPSNPDEVIIVVNGDLFGYNKMYCYNVRTQSNTYLATLDNFKPSINKHGWIVYSTVDNNIFKIKTNGDSLTQLTSNNTTKDPKWDYTGNYIFYFQMANAIVPSQLVMISSKGIGKNNFPLNLPRSAPFNNSNKVIYQKTNNSSITLTVYDFSNLRETPLISGRYNPTSDSVYFDNLCLDNNDNFFYWSNHLGIFRCSLSSLHVDTVFKNCENVKYLNPVFQKSRPNELLMCTHFIKPLLPFALLHEFKAVEYDFVTSEKNILDIFP